VKSGSGEDRGSDPVALFFLQQIGLRKGERKKEKRSRLFGPILLLSVERGRRGRRKKGEPPEGSPERERRSQSYPLFSTIFFATAPGEEGKRRKREYRRALKEKKSRAALPSLFFSLSPRGQKEGKRATVLHAEEGSVLAVDIFSWAARWQEGGEKKRERSENGREAHSLSYPFYVGKERGGKKRKKSA